jgi:hypothetical protein
LSSQSASQAQENPIQRISSDQSETAIKAAIERGTQSALSDINHSKQRILYFGKPWSAGKALVDERTGLPVQIVEGCVVTPVFSAEVNAYNEKMIAWAQTQKIPKADPRGGRIHGKAEDFTTDLTDEDLSKLAASQSEKEYAQNLSKMFTPAAPTHPIRVTARSSGTTWQVMAAADGSYSFTGLPNGLYEVFAETLPPVGGSDANLKVSATRKVQTGCGELNLRLHRELIVVSGRVIDEQGNPVADAKVTGIAVPTRGTDVDYDSTMLTVSGTDGTYELKGFEPLGIYQSGVYLSGSEVEFDHSHADIRAQKDQFEQDPKTVRWVPLVSEAQIIPARRFRAAVFKAFSAIRNKEVSVPEAPRNPHRTRGSRIEGIDIVLKRVPRGPDPVPAEAK